MKPICTTIAMSLAAVAFLAGQDAATKAKAKDEGALVILQQAPQDKTVSIPLETLK